MASAALAQSTQGSVAAPVAVQEVVVTGSHLGAASAPASPSLVVIGQDDILMSKTTSLEDILSHNPAIDFNGGASQASNNGGGGASVVDLRNLGPQRTLVLIDGMRLISDTGANVDLNMIPPSAVDRVEILKDGASSIYGADAIGGVVNIITKKIEAGATIEAHAGESGHGDGVDYGVDGSIGWVGDRARLRIGFDYDKRDPVEQANRDWAVALHGNDPNFAGGSTWRSQLDVLQNANNPSQIWIGGAQRSTADPSVAALAPNLGYVAALGRVELNAGGPSWGFLTDGLDRKQIDASGRYQLTPNVTVVLDGFFTDADAQESLRPDPLLGVQNATSVFPGFIIPAGLDGNNTGQALTANLTPAQFGPRRIAEDSQTYRVRLGLDGSLGDALHWKLGYVDQGNTTVNSTRNQANFMHLAELTGQIPCVDVPGGCLNGLPAPAAQVNFFNGPNIFTPAQVAYLTFDNKSVDQASQRYAYGSVDGTLAHLPAGDLQAAAGFEVRDEHFAYTPSQLEEEGWDASQSFPTSGGYSVRSLYGEARVPLLAGLPGARSLILTPSVRFDDYSHSGGHTTYKVALDYAVSRDLRFYTTYATEIRAPRVGELFNGVDVGDASSGGDPCETNPSASAAVAQNRNLGRGVLAAGSTCSKAVSGGGPVTSFHDPLDDTPNSQIQIKLGGNQDLQPEHARTQIVGAALTPRWTPGLRLSAEYYDVIITDTILTGGVAANAGVDLVLNGCYGPAQNAAFCSLIQRNAAGQIVQINSLNSNFGTAKAQGIDYDVRYDTAAAGIALPNHGTLIADLSLTNQIKHTQTNPDGSTTNFNGFFNPGSETNEPKWKAILSADYLWSRWQLHYDVRYTRHTGDIDGAPAVFGDAVPDLWYHDLSISYRLDHIPGAKDGRVIAGVDNLFDQDPPFVASDANCKCNTIARPFDVVGRFAYLRFLAHL